MILLCKLISSILILIEYNFLSYYLEVSTRIYHFYKSYVV